MVVPKIPKGGPWPGRFRYSWAIGWLRNPEKVAARTLVLLGLGFRAERFTVPKGAPQ